MFKALLKLSSNFCLSVAGVLSVLLLLMVLLMTFLFAPPLPWMARVKTKTSPMPFCSTLMFHHSHHCEKIWQHVQPLLADQLRFNGPPKNSPCGHLAGVVHGLNPMSWTGGCIDPHPWRILTVLLYMVLHGSHQYTPFMLANKYQHHGSVMGHKLWDWMLLLYLFFFRVR